MNRTRPDTALAPTPEQDRLQLLTETQVSELLAIPLQTLRNHRSQRRGLPFIRLGRHVRYRRSDVLAYIEAGAVAMSQSEGNARA